MYTSHDRELVPRSSRVYSPVLDHLANHLKQFFGCYEFCCWGYESRQFKSCRTTCAQKPAPEQNGGSGDRTRDFHVTVDRATN